MKVSDWIALVGLLARLVAFMAGSSGETQIERYLDAFALCTLREIKYDYRSLRTPCCHSNAGACQHPDASHVSRAMFSG